MIKEDLFIDLIKNALPESFELIGDDTAYIIKKDLILTQDTLIENVHFRQSTISPYYLGRKSVSTTLSDIAAAGGVPSYILISLSLPKNIKETFVKEFYKGVQSVCLENDVIVVGGDLTRSFHITASVCAVGFGNGLVPASRKNAKAGDFVIVTGNFGSSRAGLEILQKEALERNTETTATLSDEEKKKFIHAHINPLARLKEGRIILRTAKKPALMDASDGLGDALYKICLNSKVGMMINFAEVPFDKELNTIYKSDEAIYNTVMFGGEDYELVGTVSESAYQKLIEKKISVTRIGEVIPMDESPKVFIEFNNRVLKIDSEVLGQELFSHFESHPKG